MNDFKSILNSLNLQDEESQVQVPLAPGQDVLPSNYNELAQQEIQAPVSKPAAPSLNPAPLPSMKELGVDFQGVPTEPSRAPADTSSSSLSQIKTKIAETIPQSDSINGSETAEARLERLMRELNDQRSKEREDAEARKFKADIIKAFTDNAGTFVGGMQAKNTKAAVTPVKTQGYDVGDLVGQVDKKFAGDREALLDQYKQLLNARDRADQRKFQQESLNVQREGNRIKQQLAQQKADAKLTEGQIAQDKDFGKINNEWTTSGRAKFDSNLGKLQEVVDQIKKMPKEDQENRRSIRGGLYDFLQPEEDINMREAVRSAAQESLRATLGAQFTEKEGEAIMNRAYDPTLSPASNLKRIEAVMNELIQKKQAMDARSKEFEKSGTLSRMQTTPNNTISNSEGTVERLDKKTGKIAIFDAQTKKFLKYKD